MRLTNFNLRNSVKRTGKRFRALAVTAAGLGTSATLMLTGSSAAALGGSYPLFGDAQLVSPGHNSPMAAQFESSTATAPGYGGVNFTVPAGMTLSQLNNLATDYEFTAGSCAGGAPRFTVDVTNGTTSGSIFAYIGPAPNYTGCPQNVWGNTGNLAAPANLVDATQLGGAFYEPYATAQAAYGSYTVTGISLVTDSDWVAGNDPQTVLADNVQINGSTYTFESKDSCKNGGWQQFTSAPGPFKTQGDCVSYFATNGNNPANGQ